MNMNYNFSYIIKVVINILADWLLSDKNDWAWCRIPVDNNYDE